MKNKKKRKEGDDNNERKKNPIQIMWVYLNM